MWEDFNATREGCLLLCAGKGLKYMEPSKLIISDPFSPQHLYIQGRI